MKLRRSSWWSTAAPRSPGRIWNWFGLLRKTGRPLFLAVNKADTEKQAHIVDEFHRLGIKQMFPISAEHGRGIDDLLDAVFEVLPPAKT